MEMDTNAEDSLFASEAPVNGDFVFNDEVAAVFDDMLARSVPFYAEVVRMMGDILDRRVQAGDSVYDLGCSTGSTLLELSRRLDNANISWIGYDNAPEMVERAREKAGLFHREHQPEFRTGDILEQDYSGAGAILLNYTLQFLRPVRRREFLKKLAGELRPGGVCLLSEKTVLEDPQLNRAYIDFYLDFKRRQGYSELEIARKREALENVLIPFSREENVEMLREAGFVRVEPFFQWFNFTSFLALKSEE